MTIFAGYHLCRKSIASSLSHGLQTIPGRQGNLLERLGEGVAGVPVWLFPPGPDAALLEAEVLSSEAAIGTAVEHARPDCFSVDFPGSPPPPFPPPPPLSSPLLEWRRDAEREGYLRIVNTASSSVEI